MNKSDRFGSPLSPAIDLSSAQFFSSSDSLANVHEDKFQQHRYGRDSGEGALHLEKELENWYPGFKALAFRSGMAALETLFQMSWTKYEQISIQSEIYRKTEALVSGLQNIGARKVSRPKMNPETTTRDHDIQEAQFVFLEIPSNPHLRLLELDARFLSTNKVKPFIAIDATMSGFGNLKPEFLESVDTICFSLTKFIGGHNDVIGGVLFVKNEIYEELWMLRSRMGNIISPFDAFLSLRSLKTLNLRMSAHLDTSRFVLDFIQSAFEENKIRKFFYPGLGENADQKDIVNRILFNGGSVLSFIPDASREVLATRLEKLRTVKMAPSFGSTDSLIEICSLMTRPNATTEELRKSGLEPNLIRLSVGIDRPQQVIDDLKSVLFPS